MESFYVFFLTAYLLLFVKQLKDNVNIRILHSQKDQI